MNWYKKKKRKYKDNRTEGDKIDTQLLCCGFPENRRKDPYKPNKKRNWPATPENTNKKASYNDSMNKKKLIISRGVPGSGKSTLAKELGKDGVILGSDDFFMVNGEYKFDASKLHQAHKWNQNRVKQAMEQGISPIVVDNTNTMLKEIFSYAKLAKDNNYTVQYAEPNWHPELKTPEGKWNFDFLKGRNIHGVPDEVLKRMIDRYQHKGQDETDDDFTKRVLEGEDFK